MPKKLWNLEDEEKASTLWQRFKRLFKRKSEWDKTVAAAVEKGAKDIAKEEDERIMAAILTDMAVAEMHVASNLSIEQQRALILNQEPKQPASSQLKPMTEPFPVKPEGEL